MTNPNHTGRIPDGDRVPQPPRTGGGEPATGGGEPAATWSPASIAGVVALVVAVVGAIGAAAADRAGADNLASTALYVTCVAGGVAAVAALILRFGGGTDGR
ncbi:hypothetical protein ACGFKZ_29535 [Micromonospora tulbaghiae]|uniref:hypothetical protein n=1 Tax=Micromonospora tulbaghiae TaxID=479978 RepID=UPI0037103EC2